MKVKVYLNSFGDDSLLNDRNELEVTEGITLAEVMNMLKLPKIVGRNPFVSINNKKTRPDQILKEGDSIIFINFLVGG